MMKPAEPAGCSSGGLEVITNPVALLHALIHKQKTCEPCDQNNSLFHNVLDNNSTTKSHNKVADVTNASDDELSGI
jgi:hypothetical protein